MNLNTISEVSRFGAPDADPAEWRDGDAWLAGGTWLFSEPQPHLRRLVDLHGAPWDPYVIDDDGLTLAATCTIAELMAMPTPPDWTAAPLIGQCCNSFLASFKVWNTSTVGGNICMSLPAGPMISLTVALGGRYVLWRRDGREERVAAEDFVIGDNRNILEPGDLLRSIELPIDALRKRTAFRHMSLTKLGRSTALLIGTVSPHDGTFELTVTASTKRPLRLGFSEVPSGDTLHQELDATIPDELWHDDVHGAPDYRHHLTYHFAESIRRELVA